MIGPLLERAGRLASQADAALKRDETTTLTFRDGRLQVAATSYSWGVNLRVVVDGRLGVAGTSSEDIAPLLDAALSSARVGEAVTLSLPRQGIAPRVLTLSPRAAAATLADLTALGTMVRDRLAGTGAQLAIEIERSLGSVRVGNSLGLDAGYDVTLFSLAVEAWHLRNGRRVTVRDRRAGSDLPDLPEIERLVASVRQRLAWCDREAEAPVGRMRVAFMPAAVPLLLQPVEQALVGKTAVEGGIPFGGPRRGRVFSESITLLDDPLAPGRPASRPVDDEGVVSRPVTLVQAGTIESLIYDLETACRVGATPTGHGRRSTFAKPQPAFSNLVLEPGTASWEELLAAVGDGLLLDAVGGTWDGNVIGGAFSRPAELAWRVSGGEVQGLVAEVTVAGNANDLLGRVVAQGKDAAWVGSRSAPTVVVDGVSVF
ncbi:MAG TPA: TldD/PmbA family protein [Gemmatimonadales bacterium]|nr:TldD/PmbA family protein [Gemmatimonadales bacterium]